jgi:hypothetical protein
MGRLTLNVLLSFAQFEREVTGERIRDKIAASKKKGIWVGGVVPLGYELKDRKLFIHEQEARIVRLVFERYLALGSLPALQRELREQGILTRKRLLSSGAIRGGVPLTNGPLVHLLRNRMYCGEINHRDRSYPGEHQAIIDQALFDQVQARLSENRRGSQLRRQPSDALLLGKLFDDRGNKMTPSYAIKGGVRYRYYVSSVLAQGRKEEAGTVSRIGSDAIESSPRCFGDASVVQERPRAEAPTLANHGRRAATTRGDKRQGLRREIHRPNYHQRRVSRNPLARQRRYNRPIQRPRHPLVARQLSSQARGDPADRCCWRCSADSGEIENQASRVHRDG